MTERGSSGFGWRVLPAIAYVIAVFLGGSLPAGPELPQTLIGSDKLLHLLVFGGMVLVLWRATGFFWPRLSPTRQIIIASMASSGLGAVLELYQGFLLPSRSMELLDWVFDTVGIAAVAVAAHMLVGRDRSGSEHGASG
ncbi:VanZ family protein [Myxococcota bacterium]